MQRVTVAKLTTLTQKIQSVAESCATYHSVSTDGKPSQTWESRCKDRNEPDNILDIQIFICTCTADTCRVHEKQQPTPTWLPYMVSREDNDQ